MQYDYEINMYLVYRYGTVPSGEMITLINSGVPVHTDRVQSSFYLLILERNGRKKCEVIHFLSV